MRSLVYSTFMAPLTSCTKKVVAPATRRTVAVTLPLPVEPVVNVPPLNCLRAGAGDLLHEHPESGVGLARLRMDVGLE